MEKVLVGITTKVPITIFELPQVKEKVNSLFKKKESEIRARFDQIKTFIRNNRRSQRYETISYEEVTKVFKIYFYGSILSDVVKTTFSDNNKFDVVDNTIDLLTEEKLEDAILGEPMICAYKKAIEKIPKDNMTEAIEDRNTMLLIEKKFLWVQGKRCYFIL